MLLVGDIGGTQARLALVSSDVPDAAAVRAEQVFRSADFPGLEALVDAFLQPHQAIERAVFAVAGPVVNRRAELTNLGWKLDEQPLAEALGVRSVHLLNDLLALAMAVPQLSPEALHTLQSGEPQSEGAMAVVAPGTGLGEAFITWDGTRYRAHPSEGGHADFAPADSLQRELLQWFSRTHAHVSYERVCSGRGLPNLYQFLKQVGHASEEEWLAAKLQAADDPTPVIVQHGLGGADRSPLCTATLELFATILAAEAGNVALRVLATGGVYLGGGMVLPLLRILKQPMFTETFRRKGRLESVLSRIPLYVITRKNIALQGAIHYALAETSA